MGVHVVENVFTFLLAKHGYRGNCGRAYGPSPFSGDEEQTNYTPPAPLAKRLP